MNIDPFSTEVTENPIPFFDQLRSESPVYKLPNNAYYLVSRYEDIMKIVMDVDTYSSNLVTVLQANQAQKEAQVLEFSGDTPKAIDVLAVADPPSHTRQRKVSNRAFTRRRVEAMESTIRTITDELIDSWINKGEVDWVTGLAIPLPMKIIVHLLGLPIGDIPQLKRWSDASVALLSGINTEEELHSHNILIGEMFRYLGEHLDRATDNPPDTVIGDLVRESQVNNEFGRDEMTSILVQLLTGGNETTTSLISSGMKLLLQQDGLQEQLRQQPHLVDTFIEEALRLESPFYGHFRVTTKATSLGGIDLPKGTRLMLLWVSANRDSAQFVNPDQVDLHRNKPKKHLSFGYGIHHCIGAALARMEARIAFDRILSRTHTLRLANNNRFDYVPSLFVRSLKALQLEFD